ncbi:hypothetical protein BD626DRAFT_419739 [Schizophyllum amplum]|uniref:Uncharacterized protein n=1 Tax=Schizophyllum amplum TaxID=97359 RepID=A0A550BRP7_9AGAR|nr:hypothetical protein BD626DRAFT_419739 [Auriculariopsis ampla]
MEEEDDDPDAALDEEDPPASSPASAPSPRAPFDGDSDSLNRARNQPPSCPADALPWFQNIFDVVNRPELGDDYYHLLRAWTVLESNHGFDINKGATLTVPGAPAKPTALTAWINGGRRAKKPIILTEVKSFEREMWAWWNGLQPDWRERDAAGYPTHKMVEGGSWGVLAVNGQNGLASAVACLCWWGLSLGDKPRASWARCVADVTWVCQHVSA